MGGGTKEHAKRIRKSQFNRQRAETDVLRSNCGSDGYVFGTSSAKGQCQFHHVLPVQSMQDGSILDKGADRTYIKKCMAATKWDVNEQPNLIGLPTKKPFQEADRLVSMNATVAGLKAKSAPASQHGALMDLPSHLNGHDKYNQAVIGRLNNYVWPELLSKPEKCDNRSQDLKATLEGESDFWKVRLNSRGQQHGGAVECWVFRETTKREVWHIPLSMAPYPKWEPPPPNPYKNGKKIISEMLKEWREKIFAWAP